MRTTVYLKTYNAGENNIYMYWLMETITGIIMPIRIIINIMLTQTTLLFVFIINRYIRRELLHNIDIRIQFKPSTQ